MKRQRATQLAEQLLHRLVAGHGQWPLHVVTKVHVFGSYARGASQPHDLDIAVDIDRGGERWPTHFVQCMCAGRSPYSVIRRALAEGARSYQFMFETGDGIDFPLTLLWQIGDSLETALARLHAIVEDDTASRAPRDAMLPQFDGLDRWIPRPYRERLIGAVDAGAISLQRLDLPDATVANPTARRHLQRRWGPTSPLLRAGHAILAHLERRGVDPAHVHLHGKDVANPDTPYFAGFQLRYFRSIPHCLTDYHGVEWIDVGCGSPGGSSPQPREQAFCSYHVVSQQLGDCYEQDVPLIVLDQSAYPNAMRPRSGRLVACRIGKQQVSAMSASLQGSRTHRRGTPDSRTAERGTPHHPQQARPSRQCRLDLTAAHHARRAGRPGT